MLSAAQTPVFLPHILLVDGTPALIMTRWEAVFALFGILPARPGEEQDLLSRLQTLAVHCALGLVERQEAYLWSNILADNVEDAPQLNGWLDLYIDTYLARPGALATAQGLLADC